MTMVVDGWGPMALKQLFSGGTYQLHSWDESSGYGYEWMPKSHTVDDHIDFCLMVIAKEASIGHTVTKFKFDRFYLDADELARRLAVATNGGTTAEVAASADHEKVGLAESHMDGLTRAAEAMIAVGIANLPRGVDPRAVIGLARKYAVWQTNHRSSRKGEPARVAKHRGRVPDFNPRTGMLPPHVPLQSGRVARGG